MRYTPSIPSVNSTRLRRSETVKMFFRLSICSRDELRCPACRRDLLRRLAAEPVGAYRHCLVNLTAPQHFQQLVGAADQPVLDEQRERDDGARVEPGGERVEVDDLVLDAKRVVEAALWHAPVPGALAPPPAALEVPARTRLGALVSPAGGLAVARSLAAPDPLLGVFGALGRAQVIQSHVCYSTDTRGRTLWIMRRGD